MKGEKTMKKGKSKILLLVLAMILSTFAMGFTFEDREGNDSFLPKVDPPVDKIFYFDEDGDIVTGPTDYWVEFDVSNDKMELSFEAHNIEIELVSVKGGPNGYRVYSDLDDSESGLTPPTGFENDQETVKYYEISHYSFVVDKIVPPPDSEGEIDITKIVVDKEEEVIEEDETTFTFKIELQVGENDWDEIDESPVTIDGNGTETISGLPMGTYRITEIEIDEDYTLISENELIRILEDNGDEVKAEFTNEKDSEEPPQEKGSLKVQKRIMRPGGSIDANLGDGVFTVRLTGPNGFDEEKTIEKPGVFVTFEDLPYGNYSLEETYAYDPELTFVDYFFSLSGNQNPSDIIEDIDIDSEGEVLVWLINEVGEPWEGNIRVIKSIPGVQAPDETLEGFEFTLTGPDDYEEIMETDEYGEIDFTGLAEGEYFLEESYDPDYTSSIPDGITIELPDEVDEENDNYAIVRVTNTPVPDDWEGIIRVEKSIAGEDDPKLSGIEFTLEGPDDYEETMATDEEGILEFTELAAGIYTLTEVVPEGYRSTLPEEGLEIELPEDANKNNIATVEVTNRLIPEPDLGEIEVEKIVRNRANNIMESNTRFYFVLEMLVEDEWDEVDDGSIVGNGTLVFDELEDGEYRVREVNIDNDFRLVSGNNVEVEINDGSSEEVEFTNRLRPRENDDDDDEDEPEDEPEGKRTIIDAW